MMMMMLMMMVMMMMMMMIRSVLKTMIQLMRDNQTPSSQARSTSQAITGALYS